MKEELIDKVEDHATDHLANERTFLAWIRTAVSIIAFGFVVIKFLLPHNPVPALKTNTIPIQADNHAVVTGISFFFIGAAISTLTYLRYRLTGENIVSGKMQHSSFLSTFLLVAILIICAMLTIYFLKTADI
jgi:putative membrane protein